MKLTQQLESPFNPVLKQPVSFDLEKDHPVTEKPRKRARSTTRHPLYPKTLHVSVPQKLIDDLFAIAEYNSMSIPAVVRTILIKYIDGMK